MEWVMDDCCVILNRSGNCVYSGQQLSSQRGGSGVSSGGPGTGGKGRGRSDVYQPPMRGAGGVNPVNSHASSKSAHYNSNANMTGAGGGGPRSNFGGPLSPESPMDNVNISLITSNRKHCFFGSASKA